MSAVQVVTGSDVETFVKLHAVLDTRQMSGAFSLLGTNYPHWREKEVAYVKQIINDNDNNNNNNNNTFRSRAV